eukprot:465126_1
MINLVMYMFFILMNMSSCESNYKATTNSLVRGIKEVGRGESNLFIDGDHGIETLHQKKQERIRQFQSHDLVRAEFIDSSADSYLTYFQFLQDITGVSFLKRYATTSSYSMHPLSIVAVMYTRDLQQTIAAYESEIQVMEQICNASADLEQKRAKTQILRNEQAIIDRIESDVDIVRWAKERSDLVTEEQK